MMDGIPEGYEFVRVGRADRGEWVVGPAGTPQKIQNMMSARNGVIIRKLVPVCFWTPGVFRDGYLTQDAGKGLCWWRDKPEYDHKNQAWVGNSPVIGFGLTVKAMRVPPAFDARLDMHERIQQVGPKYEAENP